MVYYGLFFHSALQTFSDLGWGPAPVSFVFIKWICEHCVILCFFSLASLHVSFLLHFSSSHRLPFSPVSIISIRFTFVSFCVMMTRISELLVKFVTPFVLPIGFDPGFLG